MSKYETTLQRIKRATTAQSLRDIDSELDGLYDEGYIDGEDLLVLDVRLMERISVLNNTEPR